MRRWHQVVASLVLGFVPPCLADPFFVVHYYPYTVSLVRTIARPQPDYQGWHRERMANDLARLEAACIDVAMVSVNPYEVRDPAAAAPYLEFVDLAATTSVEVAFMIEAHDAPREDVAFFLHWCAGELPGRRGYHHLADRPLVEIYDALAAETINHDALAVRHTVWAREWYWGVAWDDAVERSRNGEQAMAFAGFLENGDKPQLGFKMPREDGACLERQLNAALATGARYICIASWNDFREGHFIEPNTVDGTDLYDALKRVTCNP